MTRHEWDLCVDTLFKGNRNDASDFYCWLRKNDCCPLDFSVEQIERYFRTWNKSRRKGKHRGDIDRRRRQQLGPGKFHGASSACVYLNKMYVKGWGGINPANP